MLEGIVVSVVVAYAAAWLFLKAFHWYDSRQADKIRESRERRQLIRDGFIKSKNEIFEEARANQFPD